MNLRRISICIIASFAAGYFDAELRYTQKITSLLCFASNWLGWLAYLRRGLTLEACLCVHFDCIPVFHSEKRSEWEDGYMCRYSFVN